MNCVLFAKMNQVFSFKKLKKYWENGKKYWKSQGILSVRKSGGPELGMEEDDSEVVVKEDGDKRLVVICNKLVVKDGE